MTNETKIIYCFDNGESPFHAYYSKEDYEENHNWGNRIEYIEYSEYEKLKEENEELKKRLEERDQVRLWNENEKLREERDYWKRSFYTLQDAANKILAKDDKHD